LERLLITKRATSPLLLLPVEILYQIISYLEATDYVRLVLSSYVQFQVRLQDIVPSMPTSEWTRFRILNEALNSLPNPNQLQSIVGAATRPIDILSMPPELMLNILNNMSRFEQVNFMLATWHFLIQNRVVPQLTDPALLEELRVAGLVALSIRFLRNDSLCIQSNSVTSSTNVFTSNVDVQTSQRATSRGLGTIFSQSGPATMTANITDDHGVQDTSTTEIYTTMPNLSLHSFRTPSLLDIPFLGDESAGNSALEVLSTEPEPGNSDAEEILESVGLETGETYQTRSSAENTSLPSEGNLEPEME
jgi:hypothetical protein